MVERRKEKKIIFVGLVVVPVFNNTGKFQVPVY
jgi:hypothetical protein